MFNSLSGVLAGVNGEMLLLQGLGGIEWEIGASAHTIATCLDRNSGTRRPRIRLFIHLYHREDQMRLYGFSEERERRLFLELIKVSGIGPRQALRVLSGMKPDALLTALQKGDHRGLSQIPGLGIKTAQKIILALHGSVDLLAASQRDDIVSALIDMGYDRRRVQTIVEETKSELGAEGYEPDGWESELLRRSILRLGQAG